MLTIINKRKAEKRTTTNYNTDLHKLGKVLNKQKQTNQQIRSFGLETLSFLKG